MEFSSIAAEQNPFEILEDAYVGKILEKSVVVHWDGQVFCVPKSQLDDPAKYPRWWQGDMLVRAWFCRKNGLI